MSNSARSRQSGGDDGGALRKALHGHGDYIAHKYDVRRAHDVKPDYLQQVLDDIRTWSHSNTGLQRSDITKIRSLEDQIYAAISLYVEPENRKVYFDMLRTIADQLKRI